MVDERIGIADAVRALRSELMATIREGEREDLRFSVDSVEVDLALAVEHQKEVHGGVDVRVVSFGGKGSMTTEVTHRIKLSMTPRMRISGARDTGAPGEDGTLEAVEEYVLRRAAEEHSSEEQPQFSTVYALANVTVPAGALAARPEDHEDDEVPGSDTSRTDAD